MSWTAAMAPANRPAWWPQTGAKASAADRREGLGRIAAVLGPDADSVPLGVGCVLSEGPGGAFGPSPGSPDQAGGQIGGPLAGQAGRRGGDRRPRGDAHEGVEQLVVA